MRYQQLAEVTDRRQWGVLSTSWHHDQCSCTKPHICTLRRCLHDV